MVVLTIPLGYSVAPVCGMECLRMMAVQDYCIVARINAG